MRIDNTPLGFRKLCVCLREVMICGGRFLSTDWAIKKFQTETGCSVIVCSNVLLLASIGGV